MSIEVKNSKGLAIADGVRILLYGPSGIGKTATAITTGKTIIITSEKGDLTLNDYDIDIIHINSLSELKEAYIYIKDNIDKYDTVLIDSLTDIGETIVQELKDSNNYSSSDTYKMWSDFTTIMTKITKSFRDLRGINVVLIALEESEKNGLDEKLMPMIPAKKAKKKLISLYDIVIRIGLDESNNRIFYTQPQEGFEAKDRSSKLKPIEPYILKKEQSIDHGLGTIISKALGTTKWNKK